MRLRTANKKKSLKVTLFLILIISAPVLAQEKLLTIDDIYDPSRKIDFNGTVPRIRWLKSGTHYLVSDSTNKAAPVEKVNALTGEATPFVDAQKMAAAIAAVAGTSIESAASVINQGSYNLDPSESAVLLNWANDLFLYDIESAKAWRLTNNPEAEAVETFSPNGRMIAFVRNNNLYSYDLDKHREHQLTQDGGPKILNGLLDWVYQEELYGRGNFQGYWWSPDSSMVAYLRLDEQPVPEFLLVDHIPYNQQVEVTSYPKAGDPNPAVKLGVVKVTDGGTQWINTSQYQAADLLIVRVSWTPDSKKVAYQAQNREQTFLDLNLASVRDGVSGRILRETSQAWVEVIDNPHWLKDGSFLWESERNGWRHLYSYSAEGKLLSQITDGQWEVRSFEGLDEKEENVFFTATEASPVGIQAYSATIREGGTTDSRLTRLTRADGTHRVSFSPSLRHFIDFWSDVNTPTKTSLYDRSGTLVRVIAENDVPALKQYKLGKVELMHVKTRDGFVMEAMMIKPPNFDVQKRYPVIQFTYSGPHTPQVRNIWGGSSYMWHQMMAQKGYLIWICDNRSASGKGATSTWPVYRNFGELELRDLEDGLTWLKAQAYVEGSRIGIWGWSYGGFMASYALTHSKSFKLGIAGGTVADWRNYDTIYTERYMQTPEHNPEGYRKSSPVTAAKNLNGKLLLIHGALDDNVHVQNAIQFAYELQKAGKQFQFMIYPKSRHGITDPLLVKHLRSMMTDFILENL